MQAINVKERLKLAREKCPGMPEEVYLFADFLSEQMNEELVPTGVAMAIALALDEFRCERAKRHEGPEADYNTKCNKNKKKKDFITAKV